MNESGNAGKKKKAGRREWICLSALLVLCILCFGAFLVLGSVEVSVRELVLCMLNKRRSELAVRVIRDIRLPRALAGFFLGGALALAGYLMQTFFHNPLAGPFVLGISSGAKMLVALTLVFGLGRGLRISSWSLVLASFMGALMTMWIVMMFAGRVREMSTLIICGVMIGYICSAVTDLIVTFANDADIVNLHNWSRGSFSGIGWQQIRVLVPVVLVSALGVFYLSKPIGAYLCGQEYAASVGVNVKSLRFWFVILSCFLSGAVVAFAGPVSFVGIAVPFLIRWLMRSERPIWVIPGCFLGGGLVCLICDLVARCAFAPIELSISTVTAFFGAPVVLVMLTAKKGGRGR